MRTTEKNDFEGGVILYGDYEDLSQKDQSLTVW